MDAFKDFITPDLFILIPVMNILGTLFKKNTKINNDHIPFLLAAISIFLCLLYLFSKLNAFSFQQILACIFSGITQGILIAASSVYAHQVYKLCLKGNRSS